MHLSTVIITKTESALAVQTVGPETTKVNIGFAKLSVGDDQPSSEDGLSKDVKNSVGNDLAINTNLTGAISEAPDTT